MPTVHYLDFPSETPFEEFEAIVRDGMALAWTSPTLQKNGRPGQQQNGVDIYGLDYLGRPVAIQCKRYKKKLKLSTVEAEVSNAEGFQPEGKLSCLYVATTAPRDAKMQREVRALSEARVTLGKFAVGILYWDDILGGLVREPAVFASHFPHSKLPGSEPSLDDGDTNATALMLGYYGRFVWHYIEIAFNEFGWLANQDPEEIRTILRLIRSGAAITSPDVKVELVGWTSELEAKIFSGQNGRVDWNVVKLVARRVENRVAYLSDMHPKRSEALFIGFGVSLGAINWHEGKFTKALRNEILRKFEKLIPGAMLPLQETLARLQGKQCYTAGTVLMRLADRELRWSSATGIKGDGGN